MPVGLSPDSQHRLTPGRYRAFISYSHAADRTLARALQRGLHQLAKPWYRPPAFRVFRDDTSLSATPALWSSIEQAMTDSEFFILLASPQAAASPWVDRELAWWMGHKPRQHVMIVLTDGELAWDAAAGDFNWAVTNALPPSLRGRFAEEPRWVDLRWMHGAPEVSLRHPGFRDALADLSAPLHGVAKEELVGEDLRQQRRWTRLRNSMVTVLVLLGLLAGAASVLFFRQRNVARAQTAIAEGREFAARANDDDSPYSALVWPWRRSFARRSRCPRRGMPWHELSSDSLRFLGTLPVLPWTARPATWTR
jgi:hypothetical protein